MFSGGFTSTTFGAGGTPTGSQDGGRSAKRGGHGLNNVPFLISDLLKCVQADGTCSLAGQDVSSVTLVGLVRSADIKSANYKYVLDDQSGAEVEVVQWLDAPSGEDDDPPVPPLMTNSYARVCGAPRSTDGKLFVVAFKASRLSDLSHLTMHLLETVHCKKALRQCKTSAGSSTMFQPRSDLGSSFVGGGGGGGGNDDLKREMQLVAEVVQMYDTEIGCPLSVLVERVKLPRVTLMKTIKFMSDEGHVYTTKDEEHFKLTSL